MNGKWTIKETEIGAGCLDDDKVWYSAMGFNGLFCYDLVQQKLDFMGIFPNEYLYTPFLFRCCKKWKDNLVFIPYNAHDIYIFNIEKKEFTKVPLNDDTNEKQKFNCAVVYKNSVVMFGENLPYILDLNLQDLTYNKITGLYDELSNVGTTGLKYYVSNHYLMINDTNCLLLGAKSNVLINYNLESHEFDLKRLGDDNGVYNNFIKKENDLYLIPEKNRRFSIWSIEQNKLIEFGDTIDKNRQYGEVYVYEKEIHILPNRAESGVCWSMTSNIIGREEPDGMDDVYEDISKYCFSANNEKWIVYYSRIQRNLYIIDLDKNTKQNVFLKIDDNLLKEITKSVTNLNEICFENSFINFNSFVGSLL